MMNSTEVELTDPATSDVDRRQLPRTERDRAGAGGRSGQDSPDVRPKAHMRREPDQALTRLAEPHQWGVATQAMVGCDMT